MPYDGSTVARSLRVAPAAKGGRHAEITAVYRAYIELCVRSTFVVVVVVVVGGVIAQPERKTTPASAAQQVESRTLRPRADSTLDLDIT